MSDRQSFLRSIPKEEIIEILKAHDADCWDEDAQTTANRPYYCVNDCGRVRAACRWRCDECEPPYKVLFNKCLRELKSNAAADAWIVARIAAQQDFNSYADDEDDEDADGVEEFIFKPTGKKYLRNPETNELYDHGYYMETGDAKFIGIYNPPEAGKPGWI